MEEGSNIEETMVVGLEKTANVTRQQDPDMLHVKMVDFALFIALVCHVRCDEETKALRDENTFLLIKGRTLKQTNKMNAINAGADTGN